ncbi:hypothetical protein SAMN05216603_113134 [Pseudomonas benzenivorans]|nr:hypothetical protein [Pseudomonas benzenivorans]SDH77281.1 hypothetical protein SAMN05216603_113134 [Pseudomonas benzenivorans]
MPNYQPGEDATDAWLHPEFRAAVLRRDAEPTVNMYSASVQALLVIAARYPLVEQRHHRHSRPPVVAAN